MHIKWTRECSRCKAPLKPRVVSRNRQTKKFIRTYLHTNPIFVDNNEQYYSFIGLKVESVCYSCFTNKPKVSIKSLKNRELGLVKRIHPRSVSKTKDEILFWYNSLVKKAVREGVNIVN